jgi:hypothetical protein
MIHVEDYFREITAGLTPEGKQLYSKWYITAGVTHWHPMPEPPEVAS